MAVQDKRACEKGRPKNVFGLQVEGKQRLGEKAAQDVEEMDLELADQP